MSAAALRAKYVISGLETWSSAPTVSPRWRSLSVISEEKEDDRQVAQDRVLLDAFAQVVAVHHGHLDVRDQDLDVVGDGPLLFQGALP